MRGVSSLNRKLFRDLFRLQGQVITIALVVAAGIAAYVTMRGTWASLLDSRDAYYDRYRFSHVFAQCKRAPLALADRIEALPGVASVATRLVELVTLPLPDEPEPAAGQIVTIPDSGQQPPQNALALKSGRWPEPGRGDEILVLDSFANARNVAAGQTLSVILNGKERDLRVVGTALSPEFVFAMEPGAAMPEADRFAVMWMFREAAAPAFDLDGAFNSVVLRLQPGASEPAVLAAIDELLEPYGGFGAVGRSHQESNYFLEEELGQLEQMATFVPVIFLAVAAFLLNVVLSRLVWLQRGQIAALKALGYSDRAIGLHYLQLVSVVVVLGALVGLVLGVWLGRGYTELYTMYFRFPVLRYRLDASVASVAILVSLGAALVGALATMRRIARMPPAEAMRPPAPLAYTRSWVDRLGAVALFGQASRMIVREILRRPLRTALSSLGTAMAVAILVAGRFGVDAFEVLLDKVFQTAMTEDLAVNFIRPMPERAVRELGHLPGVHHAEGLRMVPVRVSSGPRARDALFDGREPGLRLRRLMDGELKDVALPEGGVLLTRKLAEILHVSVGEQVRVQLREGHRGTETVVVSGLIDEPYGLFGHMRLADLNRLMDEDRMVSMALLDVDPSALDDVRRRLRRRPHIRAVSRRMATIESFRRQTGAVWGAMTAILTLFAATIAVGVVYNNARVALSMRSRDLASLRVLGFTRAEISAVLLGELFVQVLLAIPIGLVLGTWMADGLMAMADPERFRMDAVISSRTYAFATLVTLLSGLVSALLVRRKLDRLDLIGVLKTRE